MRQTTDELTNQPLLPIGVVRPILCALVQAEPQSSDADGNSDGCYFCYEMAGQDGIIRHDDDCPITLARNILNGDQEASIACLLELAKDGSYVYVDGSKMPAYQRHHALKDLGVL